MRAKVWVLVTMAVLLPGAARSGPAEQGPPLTITAVGNRLILHSNDPQALALAEGLVRLLTKSPGGDVHGLARLLTESLGEGEIDILRLKNARASEAALILDQLFNGPRPPVNGPPLPGGVNLFFGPTGAPGVPAPAYPVADRIRVVAEPRTNALLVWAQPRDLVTIRRLVEQSIDVGDTDSRAVSRTWVVGPLKHAVAAQVAYVLRSVYREQVNGSLVPPAGNGYRGYGDVPVGDGSGARFAGRGRGWNGTDNGSPPAVTLAIGVDDRSNSLVLACSEKLKDEVTALVEQLDSAAREAAPTVRVVPLRGVDPVLVQRAVDALQGRSTSVTQPPYSNGPLGPDPARFGWPVPGGFVPGGYGWYGPGLGGYYPGSYSPGVVRPSSTPGVGLPGNSRAPGPLPNNNGRRPIR
jgi:hypothetical protein